MSLSSLKNTFSKTEILAKKKKKSPLSLDSLFMVLNIPGSQVQSVLGNNSLFP